MTEQEQSLRQELLLEDQRHLKELDPSLPTYYESYENFSYVERLHLGQQAALGAEVVMGEAA